MYVNTGGSKTLSNKNSKSYKSNTKYKHNLPTIREEVNTKLIWFIHGAEKKNATVPAFSANSIAHRKKVPKINFGPCYFDSISFFSPNGHYVNLTDFTAINIGTLLCNNQTEEKFEKIPDINGNVQLRDMEFSVEPKTDSESFKKGMGVYLCIDGKNTKIVEYDELIQFGTFDLNTLISGSNSIMINRGFLHRKWDLLLCCCRVYQPNIAFVENRLRFDKYAPAYMIKPYISSKPNRLTSSIMEKSLGISENEIKKLEKHVATIRKPKTTRSAEAKKTIRLSIAKGGNRRILPTSSIRNPSFVSLEESSNYERETGGNFRKIKSSIQQLSEDDFYESLSSGPTIVKSSRTRRNRTE